MSLGSMKPTEEGTRQLYTLLLCLVVVISVITVCVTVYYSIKL